MAVDELERIGNTATSAIRNTLHNIYSALTLSPDEIDTDNIKYTRTALLLIFIFTANICAYCLSLIARRHFLSFILTAVLPIIPFLSCLIIVLYGYIAAVVYKEFLGNDMFISFYVSLLASVFTPFAIFFGCSFHYIYRLTFFITAIISDYIARTTLVKQRTFPSTYQKFQFIAISLVMNILFYTFIFPLFFC